MNKDNNKNKKNNNNSAQQGQKADKTCYVWIESFLSLALGKIVANELSEKCSEIGSNFLPWLAVLNTEKGGDTFCFPSQIYLIWTLDPSLLVKRCIKIFK